MVERHPKPKEHVENHHLTNQKGDDRRADEKWFPIETNASGRHQSRFPESEPEMEGWSRAFEAKCFSFSYPRFEGQDQPGDYRSCESVIIDAARDWIGNDVLAGRSDSPGIA